MSKLRLSDDLALPIDTVTQTVAILAKRRAGKSYLARKLAEQLLHAGQQVVIVDPKGDWYGIRSSADGRGPGFPVIIIGGERADVPLETSGGEVVARLVAEEQVSVLLDLSLLRKGEVARFMTDFLENLYRIKAHDRFRTPVMLLIDEADAIAPQKPMKGEERMLGAAEDIVRRGGQRGIGCTLISQRSAVVNKNVLTQTQVLIALRTISPQDLAAMKAWIDVHGTPEEGKELMGSLPSLPVGDAWIWSPGWPTTTGIFLRTHIEPIETYDSGATPSGHKKHGPRTVADVDLNVLKRQMAETIERQKANDPKELKKRVADLQAQVAKLKTAKPVAQVTTGLTDDQKKGLRRLEAMTTLMGETMEFLIKIQAEGFFSKDHNIGTIEIEKALREAVATGMKEINERLAADRKAIMQYRAAGDKLLTRLKNYLEDGKVPVTVEVVHREPIATRVKPSTNGHHLKPATPVERPAAPTGVADAGPLCPGEVAILKAAAMFPEGVDDGQIAGLTGYKKTSRATYKTRLSQRGLIVIKNGQTIATEEGVLALGDNYEPLPTGDELREYWRGRLDQGERKIFEILERNYPSAIGQQHLQDLSGYKKTSVQTYLTRLRVRRLIDQPERGQVALTSNLYTEN